VLNREQERIYLEFAPQPLHLVAMLMLDTAFRPAEALALMWRDIYFEASAESPFGYMRVREGKTRYRARSVSLTSRVHSMLRERKRDSESDFVFAQGDRKPVLPSSLAHLHAQIRPRSSCYIR